MDSSNLSIYRGHEHGSHTTDLCGGGTKPQQCTRLLYRRDGLFDTPKYRGTPL